MDFDFRLLLVVAGLGLIGYVAWDGWRNRARNNYKFKLERNLPPDTPERPDREGFNHDGVGRPRLRGMSDGLQGQDDFDQDDVDEASFAAEPAAVRTPARHEPVEPTFGETVTAPRAASYPRGSTPDLFGEPELSPTQMSDRASNRTERPPVRRADPDVIALMVLAAEG